MSSFCLPGPMGGPRLDEVLAEQLQAQHLGHLALMKEAGYLKVAGPFAEQPDEHWRGMALYQVGSLEEVRRLAESDPAVQAGRLEVEVMAWFTEKGALSFPGAVGPGPISA